MLFGEFVIEMYDKAKSITTEGEWLSIKSAIDLLLTTVETSEKKWLKMKEAINGLNHMTSAEEFIAIVDNKDSNGLALVFEEADNWLYLPECQAALAEYLTATPIAIPDTDEELDLGTTINVMLIGVYNSYKTMAEERADELAARYAVEDDGLEGEMDPTE